MNKTAVESALADRRNQFTTGRIAAICGVAPRTVSKWIDSGALLGHRLPGCLDRRVYRDDLIMFLQANGMDSSRIPGGVGGGGVVLCVGLSAAALEAVEACVVGGRKVTAKAANDLFAAGIICNRVCPKAVVLALHDGVSTAVAGLAAVRRVEGLEAVPGVAVGTPETTAGDTELAKQGGFTAVCQVHEIPVTVAICISNAPKPSTRYPIKKLAVSGVIQ